MAKNLTSTTKPKMAKVGCGLQVGAESETPARKDNLLHPRSLKTT